MNIYNVTIEGIGKKPLVQRFTAKCPAYAGRLAMDKFGDWIRIAKVDVYQRCESPKQPAAISQPPTTSRPHVLTWRESFNDEAKKERVRRRTMRRRTAALLDNSQQPTAATPAVSQRKADEQTFK